METITAVKERPILFSTQMVKAILEGRKTVTRRVIKESFNGCLTNGGPHPCPNDPVVFYPGEIIEDLMNEGETITVDYPQVRALFHCSTLDSEAKCPYGKPGDILWVRETWVPAADYTDCGWACENGCVCPAWFYKADMADNDGIKWKPSIFMPRAACRLRLEIQSITAERLHDIAGDDAKKEGAPMYVPGHGIITKDDLNSDPGYANFLNYRLGFEHLWMTINGAESWKANPWVWRIEFKKL